MPPDGQSHPDGHTPPGADPAPGGGSPSLDGKVVVLTGASSGFGAQLAPALAAAGARVVLAARREERLRELAAAVGGEALACDLTDAAERARLIDVAHERCGRLDALVNNAGWSKPGPASRESMDDFRRHLEINLVAPFELSQLAARRMREGGGGGAILNVASIAAFASLEPMPQASYAASKAGLVALTRELASQWGRHGIRVNGLAPGFFATEMTAGLIDAQGNGPAWLSEVPLGRPGRAGELDGAATFLLSDAASYVTGHVLAVDGGLLTRS